MLGGGCWVLRTACWVVVGASVPCDTPCGLLCDFPCALSCGVPYGLPCDLPGGLPRDIGFDLLLPRCVGDTLRAQQQTRNCQLDDVLVVDVGII